MLLKSTFQIPFPFNCDFKKLYFVNCSMVAIEFFPTFCFNICFVLLVISEAVKVDKWSNKWWSRGTEQQSLSQSLSQHVCSPHLHCAHVLIDLHHKVVVVDLPCRSCKTYSNNILHNMFGCSNRRYYQRLDPLTEPERPFVWWENCKRTELLLEWIIILVNASSDPNWKSRGLYSEMDNLKTIWTIKKRYVAWNLLYNETTFEPNMAKILKYS